MVASSSTGPFPTWLFPKRESCRKIQSRRVTSLPILGGPSRSDVVALGAVPGLSTHRSLIIARTRDSFERKAER